MSVHQVTTVIAVALAIGFAGAGCGSDDGNEKSGLSKRKWMARADAICARSDKAIDARGEKFFAGFSKARPPDERQIGRFIQQVVVPEFRGAVSRMRGLGAPGGDEQEIRALLDAADEGIARMGRNPATAEGESKFDRLAADYGLVTCADGGDDDDDDD
jgi:hypothetical protein